MRLNAIFFNNEAPTGSSCQGDGASLERPIGIKMISSVIFDLMSELDPGSKPGHIGEPVIRPSRRNHSDTPAPAAAPGTLDVGCLPQCAVARTDPSQ